MWLISTVVPLAKSPQYTPPREVARCLSSTHLFAAGPSELAGLVGWITGGDGTSTRRNTRAMVRQESTNAVDRNGVAAQRSLGCSTRFNLGDRHWQCPQRSYRLRGKCREDLYASKPFEANCTGSTRAWRNTSLRVSYYWKSYQFSRADLLLHQAVQRALSPQQRQPAAEHHRRVIVVLSAGLAQFAKYSDHREHMLHNVRDDEDVPQHWIDDWVNETSKLLRLFAPMHAPAGADGRRSACVVWRAQNIAARHNSSEPRHHPSAVNAPNHWLNRIGLALARLHGVGTLDLSTNNQHVANNIFRLSSRVAFNVAASRPPAWW